MGMTRARENLVIVHSFFPQQGLDVPSYNLPFQLNFKMRSVDSKLNDLSSVGELSVEKQLSVLSQERGISLGELRVKHDKIKKELGVSDRGALAVLKSELSY